jgi:hypothetical protein
VLAVLAVAAVVTADRDPRGGPPVGNPPGTFDYRPSGTDTILTSNQRADGDLVVLVNGFQISREPVRPNTEPLQYACDGDSLIVYEPTGTSEYTRTSFEGP